MTVYIFNSFRNMEERHNCQIYAVIQRQESVCQVYVKPLIVECIQMYREIAKVLIANKCFSIFQFVVLV